MSVNNTEKNIFGVALVKEACPICGKLIDGPIIIYTTLTEKYAQEVENMNGKVIGYAEEPCDECKEHMKLGFIIIGIDKEKSTEDDVYRTGHKWVIKNEVAKELFNDISKGAGFMDIKDAEQLGFPIKGDKNEN